jgi:hypothetical protein
MKYSLFFAFITWFYVPLSILGAQERINPGYKGRDIIGTGVSLISYRHGYLGSRSVAFPPLTVYLTRGFGENITAGPFLGYSRWNYRYTTTETAYNYYWSFTNAGARGSLHISSLLYDLFGANLDLRRTDWYISLLAWIEFRHYSAIDGPLDDLYSNTFHFLAGPVAGVRYYLLGNTFAVYIEGGRGAFGILAFGVSLKL